MSKSVRSLSSLIVSLFLVLIILSVYWQVARLHFVSIDDPVYVTNNIHVNTGLTIDNIKWAFTTPHSANWHPLTWISHSLDCEIFGMNPMGHHLVNLLLHIVNTLLLFVFLRKTTGCIWRSGFVAALFAMHPLHVESIAWISERKDVLSTLFLMLTLLSYTHYVKSPCIKRYLLVMWMFALGLMSKPMLVSVPILLLMMDYWPLNRKSRFWILVREKLPLFALAVASCIVTYLVQQSGGAVRSLDQYGSGVRIANTFVAYIGYIVKMIWPMNLSALYPHPGNALPIWQVIVCAMLLIGTTYLAIRISRNHQYVGVGWLWYVVTLVPVIGLVQVGQQAMADRYTYIPLIGLFVIIAWGIPDLLARFRFTRQAILAVPAAFIIIALSGCTWIQIGYWKNGMTLYEHALEATSGHPMVHFVLADALFDKGEVSQAIKHFKKAIEIQPNLAEAHNGLGFVYAKQGKADAAIAEFAKALKIKPNLASAHCNLGFVFIARGETDKAISHLSKAVEIDPSNVEAYCNLASALGQHGDYDKAIDHYNKALEINPDMAQAHSGLGMMLLLQDDTRGAMDHLSEALKIDPNQAEAHLFMGFALQRQGELHNSVDHIRRAVKLKPNWGYAHSSLANALYQTGDYAGAWREVRLAEQYHGTIHPTLLAHLREAMPEP